MGGEVISLEVQRSLRRGDFLLTRHAEIRMRERNIVSNDIRSMARTCEQIAALSDHKYKIVGKDLDGNTLSVIAIYENQAVIITLY